MSGLVVAACLGSGALIGFLGGVLGIGGGLIAIPALVLLMGMPQQLAQGTALIMVLPTIVMAVRKYNQHARLDVRAAVAGAVLAVPILTSVFRLAQTSAQALALSMVIPGSTIALITYSWAGQADWWVGLPLAAGSLLFVPVGVRLAYRLPEKRLRATFAAMLLATVVLLIAEA
ncbi:sulfite exporter TauE/SafE family protein [Bordetella hinzii]|uniref:sulfite exporter TauE/SafE family protein n=1 Tax=Bordetella hinzii TaxID=103855 RepID=UPI00115492BA|nr:sulfite exporter TauE/SafE family protein [Bordetella hinzii]QDJ49084.1 hypothetical protein CBR69_01480 [Bordetella hinzii]